MSIIDADNQFLDGILEFLQDYMPVVGHNTVDFFTHDLWGCKLERTSRHSKLAAELLSLTEDELGKLPSTSSGEIEHEQSGNEHLTTLMAFLSQAKRNRLSYYRNSFEIRDVFEPGKVIAADIQRLHGKVYASEWGRKRGEHAVEESPVPLAVASNHNHASMNSSADIPDDLTNKIMGQKKSHEVARMANICAALANQTELQQVIDIGSGKGYLGHFLASHHDLNIVSVDSSETNTHGAILRSKKLNRMWKGIVKNAQARSAPRHGKPEADVPRATSRKQECCDAPSQEVSRHGDECNDAACPPDTGRVDHSSHCPECSCSDQAAPRPLDPHLQDALPSGTREDLTSVSQTSTCNQIPPSTQCCVSTSATNPVASSSSKHSSSSSPQSPPLSGLHVPASLPVEPFSSDPCKEKRRQERETSLCTDCRGDGAARSETESGAQGDGGAAVTAGKGSGAAGSAVCVCITGHVDEQTRLGDLLQGVPDAARFDVNEPFMMVGLHTCGNLAPSMLRIFTSNPSMQCLVNVGCCYHHVTEEFARVDEWDREHGGAAAGSAWGFPLSSHLRNRQLALGRCARMTACMAAERLSSEGVSGGTTRSLFYRAVLQLIFRDHFTLPTRKQVLGKLAAKCKSFVEYTRRALRKLNMDDSKISDEEIRAYEEEHAASCRRLLAYNQLRACLAPSVEAVILLDRLLYLREQPNIAAAHLVELFDPVTSPRCYALIAIKAGPASSIT